MLSLLADGNEHTRSRPWRLNDIDGAATEGPLHRHRRGFRTPRRIGKHRRT